MELLFVTVIGAAIGAVFRYILPRRNTYGALLLPAVAAAAAAVVWVALLWGLRLSFDGTWIWVASLSAALLASIATAVLLPRSRTEHDARRLIELGAK